MKMYLYSYFNTEGSFHGPIFTLGSKREDIEKDYVQGLVSMSTDALRSLCKDDLYYMGCFDNITGELVPVKEFVLHVSDIASSLIAKRELEEKEDGTKEKC